MLFAIVIGTFGGTLLAILVSKWLLQKIAIRFASHAEPRKLISVTGIIFGAIALAPALFLAVMGGGTIAIRSANAIAEAIGIGQTGSAVVLALEVVAATTITVTANTALGAALGVMLARSLYRGRT